MPGWFPYELHMFSQLLRASRGTWLLNKVKTFNMPCKLALNVGVPSPVRLMLCRRYLVRLDVLFNAKNKQTRL